MTAHAAPTTSDSPMPLEALVENSPPSPHALPKQLADLYGGDLWIDRDLVYANFVSSIDGVAAVRSELRSSASISGGNSSDRLVMGILRAWADAVLIGAGTMRAHPGGRWTAEAAYPPASDAFRALREGAGLSPSPRLAVLSATGNIDVRAPSLDDATIVTGAAAARALAGKLPSTATVEVVDDAALAPSTAIGVLRSQGHRRILTEGGPNVMGSLVAARAVDELFLTVSPMLLGREAAASRPGIVDGAALEPSDPARASLVSIRRGGSYLFLRYRLSTS
jgi:riboflavin biosynthesis pyrimidine reductase